MPVKSRAIAIVAILALVAPTMASAEEPHGHGKPPPGHPAAKPAPHVVIAPHVVVHPGPGPGPHVVVHPGPGPGAHAAWVYHGHSYAWHPVHYAHPWVYPPGFAYRLWGVGAILPPLFWAANSPYYYGGWADLGLPPPDPGFQYVQYGPDLLLVNVATGEVVQVFPGAFS
jgi:hypothetical protein